MHLALVGVMIFLSFGVVTPVLNDLVRIPFADIPRATSRFMAVHGMASVLFAIIAGVWSDRLGRRMPLLALSILGSGIMSALIPHIHSFPQLLVVRFVDGACGAMATVLIFARAIDIAGTKYRAHAMGYMALSVALGFIAAPLLVATFSSFYTGSTPLILIFGFVGGGLILAAWSFKSLLGAPEQIVPTGHGFMRGFSLLKRQPRIALPAAFGFIDRYTFGTIAHLLSLMLVDKFGLGVQASALYMLGFWCAFALSCGVAVRLDCNQGTLRSVALGSFGYGLCLLLLGALGPIAFGIVFIVAGAFCALQYIPTIAWVGKLAHENERGTAMAVFNTAGSLGILAGLLVSAQLAEISYSLAFGVAGGLELLSALSAKLFLARTPQPVPVGRAHSTSTRLQHEQHRAA